MKISVFGLGYVGAVTAACFAKCGHQVVGVDPIAAKVDALNRGKSPIVEEDIEDLIGKQVEAGRLQATTESTEAIRTADILIICVGTPSRIDGTLNTDYVESVCREIGEQLPECKKGLSVVLRSTVLPGTMQSKVLPILEDSSGMAPGECYDVLFHPEFLREGSSVADFFDPPKIVVGETISGGADKLLSLYDEGQFECKRIVCELEVAETVKYCDNLFHALKVTFANEVGILCHALGIDSGKVMDVFVEDKKLNISSKYLKPGFAFGGSCLPKDLRAFIGLANQHTLNLPMLRSVLESNQMQIERAKNLVMDQKIKEVGLYGLAFKPGTDDLRESPLVELAETLLGKGIQLRIFDENVQIARLNGKNAAFIDTHLPHLADILVEDLEDILSCPLILLGHPASDAMVLQLLGDAKQVIDISGFTKRQPSDFFQTIV